MDRDGAWQAIDAQRLRVAGVLEQLSDDDWRQPSLCAGWTVRDVAAHLTMQQVGLRQLSAELVKARRDVIKSRGSMNRLIHDAAITRSALPTEQLIAEIRGMVGSRRHNVGVTYRETLLDILVHSQDIAMPLDRPLEVPPDAAALAASRAWSRGWPFYPRKRMRGFRLVATDVQWAAGDGAPVNGPMAAILLLITGRLVVLPLLSGDGAVALGARLTTSTG